MNIERIKVGKKYDFTGETRVFKGDGGKEITLHRIVALKDIELPPIWAIGNTLSLASLKKEQLKQYIVDEQSEMPAGEITEERIEYALFCTYHDDARPIASTKLRYVKIPAGRLGGWIEGDGNLSQDGVAWIDDKAYVTGNARVEGDAFVTGRAWVRGNAVVRDQAIVGGSSQVGDNAVVEGNARVLGRAIVHGYARLGGFSEAVENAWLYCNAQIKGIVVVDGSSILKRPASTQADVPKWYPARVVRKRK